MSFDMQTNVFLGGNADPILSGNNYSMPSDYDAKIAELQAMQKRLEQQRQQVVSTHTANASPTWNEIEKLTAELTDREFDIINKSEEFHASQNTIMDILQREYMRIMRPIVENTTDGKTALESHLELLKRLKKDAAKEADRNMELFNEYTSNYSDMTFSEFLTMKKNSK